MKKSIKIAIIVGIIVLAILGIILYRSIGNNKVEYLIGYEIPQEGQINTGGIVVKVENNNAYIMPLVEKPIILDPKEAEKEENNNFYSASHYKYDDSKFDLKKGQEVILTYHYEKRNINASGYSAIIDDLEIVNEESKVDIPRDIILEAYSSKDNVSIDLNKKECNNQKVEFTITDKNEYKYDYSKMRYIIDDRSKAAFTKLPRISEIPNEKEFEIDENGKISVNLDWSEVYGKLEKGDYRLTLQTINKPRRSVTDPNKMEYPDCGVIITIDFTIKSNGNMKVTCKNVE